MYIKVELAVLYKVYVIISVKVACIYLFY